VDTDVVDAEAECRQQLGNVVTVSRLTDKGDVFGSRQHSGGSSPMLSLLSGLSNVRHVSTVLVVDDEEVLLRATGRVLTAAGFTVKTAQTFAAAKPTLEAGVDILITDFRLGDATGVEVAQHAVKCERIPLMIAWSGQATAAEAFRLGQLGVLEFLEKPVSLLKLRDAIARVRAGSPPAFDALVAAQVGTRPLHELEARVRSTMLQQALGATDTRQSAAAMLGISRQLMQAMTSDATPQKRLGTTAICLEHTEPTARPGSGLPSSSRQPR
jgi:DNA-binding NtrC family response regulator